MHFSYHKIFEIMKNLKESLKTKDEVRFEVLNPDLYNDKYAGEEINTAGKKYLYRGYKAWTDLAQILHCKMLTPQLKSKDIVELRFKKLDSKESFHLKKTDLKEEKYGKESDFFKIHKNEEPSFLHYYSEALQNIGIGERKRVLSLGVNRGDEFEVILDMIGEEAFSNMELVGIDFSASAIAYATKRFKDKTFYVHDINKLDELDLGKFDLIISIGTLQSPGIHFKLFFNFLIQNYLLPHGTVVLGFPNSRWIGGEMVYGAKMVNFRESDLSLVIKDIYYCKKYLQQKKFQVRLAGKEYLFLSAFKQE